MKCIDCGKEASATSIHNGNRQYYCSECYNKHKNWGYSKNSVVGMIVIGFLIMLIFAIIMAYLAQSSAQTYAQQLVLNATKNFTGY